MTDDVSPTPAPDREPPSPASGFPPGAGTSPGPGTVPGAGASPGAGTALAPGSSLTGAARPGAPAPPPGERRTSADLTPRRPAYKGAELDPARGPGLGCFWFQVAVLAFFLVLIPVGVSSNWPFELLAALLFVALGLLLFVGQTLIFLLRLVAADRRDAGRRRPLASPTPTVGQLEDALLDASGAADGAADAAATRGGASRPEDAPRTVEETRHEASQIAAPTAEEDAPPAAEPGPEGVRE
jgi:hypothetical protein